MERRRQHVAQVRLESDQLVGRDMTEKARDVPDLTEDEQKSLSALFNVQLQKTTLSGEKGEQARARWELRANGKLVLPPLPTPPEPSEVPANQWRPIAGMVVFTEKKPPVRPIMEPPERRDGRRVEKARWFSHLDG